MRELYNGGAWTKARFNSFVKGALRAASSRYPPKYQCLKNAAVGKKINWKTGRLAMHFKCASCGKEFPQKEVQVDHINPVVDPIIGFTTWDSVIENMFCEEEDLQVLCIPCHNVKTQKEKEEAQKHRASLKIIVERQTRKNKNEK